MIAGKGATTECDGGTQRDADSTEKQQLKEPLEQHYDQHMDAEQNSEGAQRHADGAESKWRMVPEKEVDVQTFDEQISEIHTAEHRAATISVAGVVDVFLLFLQKQKRKNMQASTRPACPHNSGSLCKC